jgi:C1A family cysteine protease
MINSSEKVLHYKLNYKFNKLDKRDYKFSIHNSHLLTSPNNFSLINKVNVILDQGKLGSCVSNAFCQTINMISNNNIFLSRLSHYYCGRSIEHESSLTDSGLGIRGACNIIKQYGTTDESLWPYIISNFNILPPLSAFKDSQIYPSYTYSFVNQDINSLATCLHVTNAPIIFGITLYSSFTTQEVATTGIVPMPNKNKETNIGGHCVIMIGYDNNTKLFQCINSWGKNWGEKGIFYLPYDYILDPTLAGDFVSLKF